ncbi:MAG: recombinase family protein [Eubacteriaceae bacterium]
MKRKKKREVNRTKTYKNNVYGYVRVSTKEQHPERQIDEFVRQGIPKKNIFCDKESGRNFNREKFQKLMKTLKEEDTLMIKSLDRLGRDYHEITEQWRKITREMKVDIQVVDMPLLNTAKEKGLMGTFISDLVLQILSFVAQNQVDYIKKAQAEGIASAKARGVHCGRPRKKLPTIFKEIAKKWKEKKITAQRASEILKISRRTFKRRMDELNLSI